MSKTVKIVLLVIVAAVLCIVAAVSKLLRFTSCNSDRDLCHAGFDLRDGFKSRFAAFRCGCLVGSRSLYHQPVDSQGPLEFFPGYHRGRTDGSCNWLSWSAYWLSPAA